ncbi:hypothetical protein EFL95_04055 [Nocardioides marmorisolisilvae]|uniref:Uncharacterized protein n=2 Tax=Nocardioides marmorisolisilvae TaxID=1542737 RepID=A0A3N0DRN7_9ACTN|nr:hypothetical protein EFL95_04055 [Nocardioides marmorisolisilvae]
MIFVALAIGWAVYLLPKALRHHDEEDRRRSVEEFSDSVRVVGRGVVQTVRAHTARVAEPSDSLVEPVETRPTLTREAARNAARRRRRVLALLISTLAVVSVTSFLSYTPSFTIAIPVILIAAFLVTARLTVRAQQAVRRSAPVQQIEDDAEEPASVVVEPVETVADLDGEDTQGLSRDELAEVVGEPVLDEGGLWDPLPVTLPTYVNKARARRTVRTIEITAATTGITSSGHDAADSELAREAELQAEVEAEVDVIDTPKAAGA